MSLLRITVLRQYLSMWISRTAILLDAAAHHSESSFWARPLDGTSEFDAICEMVAWPDGDGV